MHSGAQGLACFAYPWCILLQMSDLMFLPWPSAFLQYLVPLLLEKGSLGLGLDAPKLEISQVVPGSPKNELCAAMTFCFSSIFSSPFAGKGILGPGIRCPEAWNISGSARKPEKMNFALPWPSDLQVEHLKEVNQVDVNQYILYQKGLREILQTILIHVVKDASL